MKITNYMSVCLLCLCAPLSMATATDLQQQPRENIRFPHQRQKAIDFPEEHSNVPRKKISTTQETEEEKLKKIALGKKITKKITSRRRLKDSFKSNSKYIQLKKKLLAEEISELEKLKGLISQSSAEKIQKRLDEIDAKFYPRDDEF